jgi:hypothetical protein
VSVIVSFLDSRLGTKPSSVREKNSAAAWNCGCPHLKTRILAFCFTQRDFAGPAARPTPWGAAGLLEIESKRSILQPDGQARR